MAAFANELYSVPSENVVPPNTSSRLNGDVHGAIIIEVSIVGDARSCIIGRANFCSVNCFG